MNSCSTHSEVVQMCLGVPQCGRRQVHVCSDSGMMGRQCEARLISLDKPPGAATMSGQSLWFPCTVFQTVGIGRQEGWGGSLTITLALAAETQPQSEPWTRYNPKASSTLAQYPVAACLMAVGLWNFSDGHIVFLKVKRS